METTFKQNQMQFENVSDTQNMSVYTYRDTYLYSRCMDTIIHVFLIFNILFLPDQVILIG